MAVEVGPPPTGSQAAVGPVDPPTASGPGASSATPAGVADLSGANAIGRPLGSGTSILAQDAALALAEIAAAVAAATRVVQTQAALQPQPQPHSRPLGYPSSAPDQRTVGPRGGEWAQPTRATGWGDLAPDGVVSVQPGWLHHSARASQRSQLAAARLPGAGELTPSATAALTALAGLPPLLAAIWGDLARLQYDRLDALTSRRAAAADSEAVPADDDATTMARRRIHGVRGRNRDLPPPPEFDRVAAGLAVAAPVSASSPFAAALAATALQRPDAIMRMFSVQAAAHLLRVFCRDSAGQLLPRHLPLVAAQGAEPAATGEDWQAAAVLAYGRLPHVHLGSHAAQLSTALEAIHGRAAFILTLPSDPAAAASLLPRLRASGAPEHEPMLALSRHHAAAGWRPNSAYALLGTDGRAAVQLADVSHPGGFLPQWVPWSSFTTGFDAVVRLGRDGPCVGDLVGP